MSPELLWRMAGRLHDIAMLDQLRYALEPTAARHALYWVSTRTFRDFCRRHNLSLD